MNHLSEQLVNDYRQRKLEPTQLLAMDEHLATCNQCLQKCSQIKPDLADSIASIYSDIISVDPGVDDHLSYEILESLIHNEATDVDREIADLHMKGCEQCANELRELAELRDQRPTAVSRMPEAKSFFLSWVVWPKFAITTLTVLLLALIGWLVWRSQRPAGPIITASATPSPVVVSSPALPTPSPNPTSQIVIALNDARGKVTMDNTGKIEGLPDVSPAVSASIENAMNTGQLNIGSALAGLRGKGGTLMGRGEEGVPFRLRSPVGVVVQSDRPTFQWASYPGATVYVVKVFDSDFKELAHSLSQTATSWNIPSALPRGQVYSWQVTAVKDGQEIKSPVPPAPQAQFRVLAHERLNEIRKLQTMKPTSHLALGTVYAEAGLLEQSRHEFRLLLQANPESKIATKLLQEVSNR